MGVDIRAFLGKARGMWAGAIEPGRDSRLMGIQGIQQLEDDPKPDKITASEKRRISRRLRERGIYCDDLE